MLGSKFESSKKMNDFIMIAPQLVVSNAVTTAEYYRDQLGFEILGYFSDPPVFAMVRRNGVEIHFGKADGVSSQSSNVLLRSVGSDLYVWVDNVDQLYQEFLKQEVKISEKPQNRSYLTREFSIIDCNGIKITFASDLN